MRCVTLTALLLSALGGSASAAGYAKISWASSISKERLAAALQTMAERTYLSGWRTLGHADDFFHGHLLYDGEDPRPRWILYHTQERGVYYDLYEPRSPYASVDPRKRNWVQRLDTLEVFDANLFRLPTRSDWCVAEQANTINKEMLDPAKLGLTEVKQRQQVNFFKTGCGDADKEDSRVTAIVFSNGNRVCVKFYDKVPEDMYYSKKFKEYGARQARDRERGKLPDACAKPGKPKKENLTSSHE